MFVNSKLWKNFILAMTLLSSVLLSGQRSSTPSITIRVTDAVTRRPVVNSVISVGYLGLWMGRRTDSNGEIHTEAPLPEMSVCAPNDWEFDGRIYSQGSCAVFVTPLGGSPQIAIQLLPGANVSGKLQDRMHMPVLNAHVTAYRLTYDEFGNRIPDVLPTVMYEVSTDSKGKFKISGLPNGDYVFVVTPPYPSEYSGGKEERNFYPRYFQNKPGSDAKKTVHLESGRNIDLGVADIDTTLGAPIHVQLADGMPRQFILQANSINAFRLPFFGRYLQLPNGESLDLRLPFGKYVIDEASATPRTQVKFLSDAIPKTVTLEPCCYGNIHVDARMASGEKVPSEARPHLIISGDSGTSTEIPGFVSIGING
ncbi:MAG TPA: carboxypeptidase-like regulatory domain-containing protein, partial [Terriglobia bacterium]|nr:carboxypeptidase-like regulatory domain-containing protein [Terriglobia bacterium]